jgi:hypothetical protein
MGLIVMLGGLYGTVGNCQFRIRHGCASFPFLFLTLSSPVPSAPLYNVFTFVAAILG